MSVFTTIIKDVKSFAAKVEAEFKKLFNEAPQWITIADGVLTYVGPIITTVATIAGGPAAGTEVNNIIAALKTDLATAAATVTTVNAATTLPTLLQGIQSQLPALLAAVKVSNPSKVAEVENYTSIISTELTALIEAIPAPVAAPAPPAAVVNAPAPAAS